VYFVERSVQDAGFDDTYFDFVYCTGVLHHTSGPLGGLIELCRILKLGGKILVNLYNSVSFPPLEARRRIAKFLGGDNFDIRVVWGQHLFPLTTRRLLKGEWNDPKSPLYDYFAIPYQTMHSIGQVPGWFGQIGLLYIGSFPPAHLADNPVMFAHEAYECIEKKFQKSLFRHLRRFGRLKEIQCNRPGLCCNCWFG
jgi:SAM-dependent methyltransferase